MGGCQTFSAMPVVPKAAEISVVRYPEVNVETSAELGDSITSYTIESRYTAGRILKEVRGSNYLMGIKPILPPQELELLGTYLGFDVYSASQCSVAVSGNFGAISPCAYGSYFSIMHDAVRNRWGVSLPDISGDEYRLEMYETDNPILAETFEKIDETRPNFRQELIYNGRVDNNVRFIYREIGSGMLRDAFTQEVQYDLNESEIVGFRGARVRIVEASNRQIRFVLLSPFDGVPGS